MWFLMYSGMLALRCLFSCKLFATPVFYNINCWILSRFDRLSWAEWSYNLGIFKFFTPPTSPRHFLWNSNRTKLYFWQKINHSSNTLYFTECFILCLLNRRGREYCRREAIGHKFESHSNLKNYFFEVINPSVPTAPNGHILTFQKRLRETERS